MALDIPTYESLIKEHDGGKQQNIITKLVMHVPGSNRLQVNADINNGDIDANKLDFTTLNTVIAKNMSLSQDISTSDTLTLITGANISVKSARKGVIMVYAIVGFKINGANAQANVTINLMLNGIARPVQVFDFGQTDTSGVGLQSTRSIQDLLNVPLGRNTVQLKAKFHTLANNPVLHISSFYLVYIPLGN